VGYRVKSKQGTRFRIWATRTLKEYLLKGYVLNNRMNRVEESVEQLTKKVHAIDLQLKTELLPIQGIFYDGQVYDAYAFVNDLLRSATEQVVLIDSYIDDTVFTLFSKYPALKFTVITRKLSKQLRLDVDKYKHQYSNLTIKISDQYHDRFLIIDKKTYHIGASLKDLGKKIFAFSKLNISVLGR
jgi:polyhydroxyalkanoate synthesis regulator phasin